VVGDIAAITDAKTEQVLPQLGSVALQSGEHAGESIARRIAGKEANPFKYKDKGTMATIGRGAAVVQMLGGRTMTGLKAQGAWGAVHLALLPTNEDRGKAVAVTFAVGAVTGTVLSFEFGLLWPGFTGRFGSVFGVLFAIEGIFFFLEAIFIAVYIFGWKYLSPWAHFWAGVPVVITGLGGAFSVVAVNSWMNQPQGFSPASGTVTSADPWKVIFNPAVSYEVPHMILAAYLVTGFLLAGIYAAGMLRGRRDRLHRLGLLIPLTVACIATPIQSAVGDTAARAIAHDQPVKF